MTNSDKSMDEEESDYLLALGEFIDQFARTEAMLHVLLRYHAKTSSGTSKAVFSGVRIDTAMSFIRRLTEVNDPGQAVRDEIQYLFQQLGEINKLRNDIIHYGANIRGNNRIVTNRLVAHTDSKIREMVVSSEILRDAASDLNKINIHASFRLLGHMMPSSLAQPFTPLLNASWRYKPPAQSPHRQKSHDSPPKP